MSDPASVGMAERIRRSMSEDDPGRWVAGGRGGRKRCACGTEIRKIQDRCHLCQRDEHLPQEARR